MPAWAYLAVVSVWSFTWGFAWCYVMFRAAYKLGQRHPIQTKD